MPRSHAQISGCKVITTTLLDINKGDDRNPKVRSRMVTQTIIALLSGGAELYAFGKGAAQTYGIMAMLADLGLEVKCTVCADASAAIGTVHRQGLGIL